MTNTTESYYLRQNGNWCLIHYNSQKLTKSVIFSLVNGEYRINWNKVYVSFFLVRETLYFPYPYYKISFLHQRIKKFGCNYYKASVSLFSFLVLCLKD